MKILIKDIGEDGLNIKEKVEPGSIGLADSDLNFKITSALSVAARLERVGDDMVIAKTHVDGVFAIECGRCLGEASKEWAKDFIVDFEIDQSSEYVDLGDEIRQEVIMSFSNVNKCEDMFSGEEKNKARQICEEKQEAEQLKTKVS